MFLAVIRYLLQMSYGTVIITTFVSQELLVCNIIVTTVFDGLFSFCNRNIITAILYMIILFYTWDSKQ